MHMARIVIDDALWSRSEVLLPKPKGMRGKDYRLFIDGVVG